MSAPETDLTLSRVRRVAFISIAAWFALDAVGHSQPRLERPPAVVVSPRSPLTQPIADSLASRGVQVVPTPERSAGLTPEALARSVGADAAVRVDVERSRRAGHQARLRVIDRDGAVRFDGRVPISGERPTGDESKSLADLATLALTTPVESRRTPAPSPGPPGVAGAPQVAAREVEADAPPRANVLPDPDALRLIRLWAAPTLTWRSQGISTPAPRPGLDVTTGSPYVGFVAGAESFPLPGEVGRWLGFGLSYSYAPLTIRDTASGTESRASDHRLRADLLGRLPSGPWGRFTASLGVAYSGFLTSGDLPAVTSVHVGPRLGVGWETSLIGPIGIGASFGVRPWSYVGSDLRRVYGETASSVGIDASVGLDGPLPLAGVRWQVQYGYLRYEDSLGGPAARTVQAEGSHQLGIGLVYRR